MALFFWLVLPATSLAAPAPGTGDTGDAATGETGATGDTGTGDTGTADTGASETAATGDTADPNADRDQDGDGYTPLDGDCDDNNRDLNPGEEEICADRLDNDCNGLNDDRCDDSAKLGSLRGGGGCTGGQSVVGTQSAVVLFGVGLWGVRRARRGGEKR